eukprot:TRINITY_DN4646_c0_g1_i2.p1 TRINITY_DN4646_c0_g1~~TRINITY_DN4646_c0_g1_i2.p1  ORF type:complete len:246 (+),score=110.31 TRINITY_DN4646_c0_g1_i2:86-823(+)
MGLTTSCFATEGTVNAAAASTEEEVKQEPAVPMWKLEAQDKIAAMEAKAKLRAEEEERKKLDEAEAAKAKEEEASAKAAKDAEDAAVKAAEEAKAAEAKAKAKSKVKAKAKTKPSGTSEPKAAEEALKPKEVPKKRAELTKSEAKEALTKALETFAEPDNKRRLKETIEFCKSKSDNPDVQQMEMFKLLLPMVQGMLAKLLQQYGFAEDKLMIVVLQISKHAHGDAKMTAKLDKLKGALEGNFDF